MKSLLLLVTIILIAIPGIVYAQTDLKNQDQAAQISDVEGLRAEFKQDVEDPSTKIVKFTMVLKSNIDSDRVRITWTTLGPNFITQDNPYVIQSNVAIGNIVIAKGQTYNIPITIGILGDGVNELVGKAEAFKADSTYIVTVRKNYATNADSEVLPITDQYNSVKTGNTIKNVLIVVLIVAAILTAGFFGLKAFLKWLDKDERKNYPEV